MSSIVFFHILNCIVALLFAAAFFAIRVSYPNLRHVSWVAGPYLFGMLSPLAMIAALATGPSGLFDAIGHVSLLGATVGLAIGVARLSEQPVPWRVAGACLSAGILAKVVIGTVEFNDTLAEWLDHGPFAVAMALAAALAGRAAKREGSRLWFGLSAALSAGAVYFLPPVYHWQALTLSDDVLSPGHQGIILEAIASVIAITTGLLLLLIVMQTAVAAKSEEAETDTLTGIYNRRGFNHRAETALQNAKDTGHILKVILFDLDRFKAINDAHGHAKGDQVLARFGDILQTHCPDSGIVARLGGEEFAMLIERSSIADAWSVAEQVRATLEKAEFGIPAVTVSAGIAGIQPDDTVGSLVRRADQWVYFAKNHGRNQVCPIPG